MCYGGRQECLPYLVAAPRLRDSLRQSGRGFLQPRFGTLETVPLRTTEQPHGRKKRVVVTRSNPPLPCGRGSDSGEEQIPRSPRLRSGQAARDDTVLRGGLHYWGQAGMPALPAGYTATLKMVQHTASGPKRAKHRGTLGRIAVSVYT